ncbi:MAG: ferrous iron transport protein B [Desulfovibrionaceae bacterium]
MSNEMLMALAGQPNAGKSTVFNMLTGARQHVANYPGVTVEKKVGHFKLNGHSVELVDLPGTYSLTSYSMEERVARDVLLNGSPAVVINVADASNLKRHLHLTFQLMEMGVPLVIALNMMDVAEERNQRIDHELLARKLGVAVAPLVGRKNTGKTGLLAAMIQAAGESLNAPLRLDYGPLEQSIFVLEKALGDIPDLNLPHRWLALKLLEADENVKDKISEFGDPGKEILALAQELSASFQKATEETADRWIEKRRYETAEAIARECVHAPDEGGPTFSDKVDRIICHRILGYPILFGVLYLMYYLSIELGYELTNYTWPALAWVRETAASALPAEGFVSDPMLRSLILWLVDSINALLNYIPIFLILFVYIAFLEDLGYMPRMAFLLDAFFRRYGLHGQSTLPLVLGGVYVGGCAVPGVMACRAVPDERARLATILVVPMMNCLAKVPLYILLIGVYFAAYKGQAMFFIATITILMALTTAKLLNLSVLRDKETAPFIMEMPPYHSPTVSGVLRRGVERVWIYVKKITTVVAAVSVILFVLMQFPGLSSEQKANMDARAQKAQTAFMRAAQKTPLGEAVNSPEKIDQLFDFESRYKSARMGVTDQSKADGIDAGFQEENANFFAILKPGQDKQAKTVSRAFKKLRRARLTLRLEAKNEIINRSILGGLGKWLEPVTKYAGFTWRVNVALLSALAAKENTVATLGALYQPVDSGDENSLEQDTALESRMARQEAGFTPLHALALMLFMALYPPCMAATMVVKVQAGSWKWMLFSLVYMTALGSVVAFLIFSGGSLLGLTGLEAMAWFYGAAVAAVIVTGLIRPKHAET